jgi:hypothetical protein
MEDMTQPVIDGLLALAGLCCLAAALVHSTVGERLFVRPIIARMDWSGLPLNPAFARRVVRLAWHVTSVTWLGFGAILLSPALGIHSAQVAYWVALATFGTAFLMTGAGTRWQHRGWPVFAVITAALAAALAGAA